MRVARLLSGLAALPVLGACSQNPSGNYPCGLPNNGPGYVGFNLSCSPNDLTGWTASGSACAPDGEGLVSYEVTNGDGAAASYMGSTQVAIAGFTPGTCAVRLSFANGFVYSTDVTFVLNDGGGGCPAPAVVPTQNVFIVNNPASTCIEAGVVGGE